MKKLPSVIIIGILCLSMFGVLTSKVDAKQSLSTVDWWLMGGHDSWHSGESLSPTAPSTNHVLWSDLTLGSVIWSPVVFDGVVYVASQNNNVYALNATTGAVLWSHNVGAPVPSYGPGIQGIAYDDIFNGYLFVTNLGYIYALDASSGNVKWSQHYSEPSGGLSPNSLLTAPVVANNIVYFADDLANVYALSAVSGLPWWSWNPPGDSNIISDVIVAGNKVVVDTWLTTYHFLGSDENDGYVYALDATTGNVVWTTGSMGHPVTSRMSVGSGEVFAGAQDNYLYAFNAYTGGLNLWHYLTSGNPYCMAVAHDIVYTCSANTLYALWTTGAGALWTQTVGGGFGSPAIANGAVYVGGGDGNYYAFNAVTGNVLWSYSAGTGFGDSAVANGVVYVGCGYGVYAFGPAPEITFDQVGIGSDFTGTALVVDGTEYSASALPLSFDWDVNSVHTFAFRSPLEHGSTQYVWTGTSGLSTAQSGILTIEGSGSVTGNFKTQYYLTVVSPYDTAGGTDWYDKGTTAYATLTDGVVSGGVGIQYVFTGWSGDATGTGLTSDPIIMNGPKTAIADWKIQYSVTFSQTGVGSDFTGTVVTIDGTNYDSSGASFWYDGGSTHDFAFQSPLIAPPGARQYDWTSTSGLSTLQSGSITVTGLGSVTANYVTRVHDVAVTNITLYTMYDQTFVYQGMPVNITVTVKNNGDFPENVTVTLYYNITANEIAGTQNVTLLSGQNETLLFIWNTAGVPYGHDYTLTAVATIPADFTATDNTLAGGNITVRIMGDIKGTGTVDMTDVGIAAAAFGSRPGDPLWNPDADVNGDGIVDMFDIALIAQHFGQHYP